MESINDLKETDIKNSTYYHFDDLIKINDFDSDNVQLDQKLCHKKLVHNILYKTLIGAKPLHIRFDKVYGFIRVYDGTIYLVLFGSEKYDANYNRIIYLISQKSGFAYDFSHNYAIIIIDSYDSLLLKNIDFS